MNERIEAIKNHIKEHKEMYILGSVCTASGIICGIFIANSSSSRAEIVQKITQIGYRNEARTTVINLIERSTPSKPVHLVGTNLYFNSLNEAARETGHTLSAISKNINGIIPNVNGDVFKLLEPAA